MQNTVAFLTTDDLSGFVTDDELARAPLARRGFGIEFVPWRASGDWSRYDAVIVRSTWDYQDDPDAFAAALAAIDASSTRLANDLCVMRWNMTKTYLLDLAREGTPIPRSVWCDGLAADDVPRLFTELGVPEIVIKPVVGANADDTYRLTRAAAAALADELGERFRRRRCIVQPFLPNVVEEGEYSVMLFGGEPSHTILKTPRAGDFRVQEEHGGIIRAVVPDPALVARAVRALDVVAPTPLYARADFVRVGDDYLLMELELIEPALYLRMDASAPERFADAVIAWMRAEPVAAVQRTR